MDRSTLASLTTSVVQNNPSLFNSDPAVWRSVGPSPIVCQTAGGACTGRVTVITPDPTSPGTLYLGSAQGGVWKSTNDGQFWTPMSDAQPDLAIGAIALGPGGTVYAGTGEPNLCSDCFGGAGLLKSTDGGTQWTQLGTSTFGGASFTKILVNPNNPNHILASTTSGIYSSPDGGATWTATLGGYVSDMVPSPSDPTIIYAANNGQLYNSTNGGASWNLISSWTDCCFRTALAMSPARPSTILAATADGSGKLWVSNNHGSSWSQLTAANGFCGGQCFYNIFVAVDPTNTNMIYLGGIDLNESVDGGTTWVDIGPGCCDFAVDIHPDKHAFAFSPVDHNVIYVGSDGGVWATNVIAGPCAGHTLPVCWVNLNTGLSLAQYYVMGTSPADPHAYIGGTQDNGAVIRNCSVISCDPLSSTWTQAAYGDGEWAGFDPVNPSIVYLTITGSPGSPVTVDRSDNGGSTWAAKATLATPGTPQCFAIDRTNDMIVYGINNTSTGSHLVKSANRGDDGWGTVLFTAPAGQGISAIAIAPTNGSIIYIGTGGGKLFRSLNRGATFTEEDAGLPTSSLSSIAIDQLNPNDLVVAFSGSSVGKHIFMSTSGGVGWTDISSNLPNIGPTLPSNGANSVVLLGGSVLLGTDQGVYIASLPFASQTIWTRAGTGLPNVQVTTVAAAADGSLVAATHGRGVWVLPHGAVSRVASLQAHSGESVFNAAVIDQAIGFAYFGTYTAPGIIVKVRLSDFRIVAELDLTANQRQDYLSSAVIDPANHFAYFGTNTNPGALLRIDLTNFTPSGISQWGGTGVGVSGVIGFRSAVIDTSGATHYAYFGTGNSPGSVLRVDLSNFSPAGSVGLPLASGEDVLNSGVIDTIHHFAYFATQDSPTKIAKINLVTFSEVSPALSLASGENFGLSAVIDTLHGFAYFGVCACYTGPAKIVEVNLSTFTETGSITLPYVAALDAALIDQTTGYAYFETFTTIGLVIQVNLASFTVGQTLTLLNGESGVGGQAAVIDTENGYAYFGNNGGPLEIVKVNVGFQPPTNWVSALASISGEDFISTLSSIDQGGWNGLTDLLKSSSSAPVLCSTSPGGVQLARSAQIVIINANTVYHMSLGTGTPSLSWDKPPFGTLVGTPACAVLYNSVYVVARGIGDELWSTSVNIGTGTWNSWVDLKGSSPDTPVLLATPSLNAGRLDLMVRGETDEIYHMSFPNGDPSLVWDFAGGYTPSLPSTASDGINLYLAVRAEDNQIVVNKAAFSACTPSCPWGTWTSLGGTTPSGPKLAMDGSGTLHIVVRGFGNQIYHKSLPAYQGPGAIWSATWDTPGGSTTTSPSIDVYGSDLGIAVVGMDGAVDYNYLVLGNWQGWTSLGGSTSFSPGLVSTSEPAE